MIVSRSDRRGGRVCLALAAVGLVSSVPVRAETPQPTQAVTETIVVDEIIDEAVTFGTPIAQALPAEVPAEAYESLGEGMASYYGHELAGNRTANGERFNPAAMTAAHRTLPMGSRLRVINQSNGKSVIVRINDRGPFTRSRIVDVSLGAAQKIAMVRAGTARVRLELLR